MGSEDPHATISMQHARRDARTAIQSSGFSSDGSDGAYGDDNWKKTTPKRKGKAPTKIPILSPGFDEDAESAIMETAIELSKHT